MTGALILPIINFYIPSFVETDPLAPEKILEGFYHIIIGIVGHLGHVTIARCRTRTFVPHINRGSTQNLALIVHAVSEKKMFVHCGCRTAIL